MDATAEELAAVLYLAPGDVRVILAGMGEPSDGLIPEAVCSEVLDHLDPWPMPRRFPDDPELYRDEPVNPLALPEDTP